MSEVMINLSPKECLSILKDKKSILVKKTAPKIETPFVGYVYCPEPKRKWGLSLCRDEYGVGFVFRCNYEAARNYNMEILSGKVIGEFVCNSIIPISVSYSNPEHHMAQREFPLTGMTDKEIMDRLGNGVTGCGWVISDFTLYDQPKELSEFRIIDNEAVKCCEYRERIYNNPDYTNGALLKGGYLCNERQNWCTKCKTVPLASPPKNWRKVIAKVDIGA